LATCCIADWQSAERNHDRRAMSIWDPQADSPAIQQVASLRYAQLAELCQWS